MLRADIVELGHAMTDRSVQTAHMTSITAQHALNEMLGVTRLRAFTAEMRWTTETGKIREILLGAVIQILNALDMIEATTGLD